MGRGIGVMMALVIFMMLYWWGVGVVGHWKWMSRHGFPNWGKFSMAARVVRPELGMPWCRRLRHVGGESCG
jgi:hypothetical protein